MPRPTYITPDLTLRLPRTQLSVLLGWLGKSFTNEAIEMPYRIVEAFRKYSA